MKLTRKGIKNKADWEAADISLPSYDMEKIIQNTQSAPVWVHFGAGNLFRIFLGGLADTLLSAGVWEKGITCAEAFDPDIISRIYEPYDNLVLAVTLSPDGSARKKVLGSLTEAIKVQSASSDQWTRLQKIFADPRLQMVSFTITEKGYGLKNTDGTYLPWIQADLDRGPEAPGSVLAMICSLMLKRFLENRAPLALVSMDNCSRNGEKLETSILEIAREWKKKGFVGDDFIDYLADANQISFPWTMIDKITPRPAASVYKSLTNAGIENMDPILTSKGTYIAPFVNAEAPQYLVVEDHFPNGRPPLEKAGVYMTDRNTVSKVEKMKVTACLNPLHTALAVYGCILGYSLIADELKDPQLRKLIHQIGLAEGLPVVTDPGILSPAAFVEEVIQVRLPNPFIPDTPQRIATDTSQKIGIRYGETLKAYVNKYGTAETLTAIPLAIAGWCRYLLGIDDHGTAFYPSSDPMLQELSLALSGIRIGHPETYTGQLKPLLSNAGLFGIDLYKAGVGKKVEGMFLEEIAGPGAVRTTLKKYL